MQHAEAVSPIEQIQSGEDPALADPLAPAGAGGLDNVLPLGQREPESATPFVRGVPKVGRNEPCPCGSGRKYKHCHGALQANG